MKEIGHRQRLSPSRRLNRSSCIRFPDAGPDCSARKAPNLDGGKEAAREGAA
jgi:hypothetical protein